MDPSYADLPEVPWGVEMSGHLTNDSAIISDVSPDLPQQVFEGIFHCQSCGKQYTRLCDLNKHVKTHSRPFKCPVQDCRYYSYGWPTEKELDRHHNDKHSAEPHTFSCLWHDCNYSSKRESNCKQHMEKVHGYHYVRSRAGSKEEESMRRFESSGLAIDNQFCQSRNKLAIRTLSDVSLTPSSLKQPSSVVLGPTSPLGLQGSSPYGQDNHIPWSSPVTSLRDNEAFLQEFAQSYNSGTPVAIQDNEWLRVPVDPRFHSSSSAGTNTPNNTPTSSIYSTREDLFRALPTIVTPKSSPAVASQVLTPVSDTSPILLQQSGSNSEATTPQDAESSRGQGKTGLGLGASNTGYLNSYGKRQVRFEKEQENESEEDDEPPIKRNKAPRGSDDDSGDPRMFCPFRVAHPEIYDVEVHSRYYSCHTEHNNISTVVRHLGRPAHNLKVDNSRQAIHSFNVTDNENGHPAAGLCKKCWRSFTDRATFDAHFRSKCETASRSKREKFQALIDTFCVTDQDRRLSVRSDATSGDEASEDAEGDVDVPMSATRSRSQFRGEDVVSRQEYQTLVDRVTRLEQVLTGAGMASSIPRTTPAQQSTVARAFTTSPSQPAFPGYYSFSPGPGPTTTPVTGRNPRTSIISLEVSGDHTVTGFYNDTDRVATTTAAYRPNINRRTDSVSTVRRMSPLTPITGGAAAQQAGGNPSNTGRAVSDSSYGTTGAAGGLLPSQHHEAFGAAVVTSAAGSTGADIVAQQHNTNRWEHTVQVGEEMMMRGMDFFNGHGSGDDLAKYLNMDSQ